MSAQARVRAGRAVRSGGDRRLARLCPDGLEGDGLSREQVIQIQRSRLLVAAAGAVEELGYTNVTVAHITRRARVSRRTFYELFANREECLVALAESIVEDIRLEIAVAALEGLPWRERVRGALWVTLAFLDREPALARVCVVQSLRGGQGMLERREGVLRDLASALDAGRLEGTRGRECPPLTAEGLVGAALTIVHARLARGEREPLTELLGELMGMIVLPYLGPAAAQREQVRPLPTLPEGRVSERDAKTAARRDPLESLNMRITYRTARVLEAIAQRPGTSNRGVGDEAGILDQGQISKLLARLQRLGLIVNGGTGHAKGEPNAWTLTATGVEVAGSIRNHARQELRETPA